jgi:hypothetical protein
LIGHARISNRHGLAALCCGYAGDVPQHMPRVANCHVNHVYDLADAWDRVRSTPHNVVLHGRMDFDLTKKNNEFRSILDV